VRLRSDSSARDRHNCRRILPRRPSDNKGVRSPITLEEEDDEDDDGDAEGAGEDELRADEEKNASAPGNGTLRAAAGCGGLTLGSG